MQKKRDCYLFFFAKRKYFNINSQNNSGYSVEKKWKKKSNTESKICLGDIFANGKMLHFDTDAIKAMN